MSSHRKFVSRLFLKNVKKMNCKENICIQEVLQKSSYNFTDITNFILYFIYDDQVQSITYQFYEFLKNKNLRSKSTFFLKKKIFCLCCMFLLEKDRIFKKSYLTVWAIQFPIKCLFQPPRSKTVRDTFLVTVT